MTFLGGRLGPSVGWSLEFYITLRTKTLRLRLCSQPLYMSNNVVTYASGRLPQIPFVRLSSSICEASSADCIASPCNCSGHVSPCNCDSTRVPTELFVLFSRSARRTLRARATFTAWTTSRAADRAPASSSKDEKEANLFDGGEDQLRLRVSFAAACIFRQRDVELAAAVYYYYVAMKELCVSASERARRSLAVRVRM